MRAANFLLTLGLSLSACGGGDAGKEANGENADSAAIQPAKPAPALAACPFKKTHDWKAFTEAGTLKVIGRVDLMMAGFKPTLAVRGSSRNGALALQLSLTPDPGAAVADQVRYQQGGTAVDRIDIFCGSDRIQQVDVVHVG